MFKPARFDRKLPATPRRYAVHAAFEHSAFPPWPCFPTKPRVVCGLRDDERTQHEQETTLIAHTVKERGDGEQAITDADRRRLAARQRDRLHAPA
jgi:hypothetical protein